MNITYDKPKVEPKYKLGDEFTSDVGKGKLTKIGRNEIAMVMMDGEYEGTTWTWAKYVANPSKLTGEEVESTFGSLSNGNFKRVNPREPKSTKIMLELSEDELKELWMRYLLTACQVNEAIYSDYGYTVTHNDAWEKINDVCNELGIKDGTNGFNEE